MSMSQMLADLKSHLEHGAQLVESHLPALAEWAQRAEADPLVQAAIDLAVPESTRAMLAGLLKSVESEVNSVAGSAAAQATQAAEAAHVEAAAAQADVPPVAPDAPPAG